MQHFENYNGDDSVATNALRFKSPFGIGGSGPGVLVDLTLGLGNRTCRCHSILLLMTGVSYPPSPSSDVLGYVGGLNHFFNESIFRKTEEGEATSVPAPFIDLRKTATPSANRLPDCFGSSLSRAVSLLYKTCFTIPSGVSPPPKSTAVPNKTAAVEGPLRGLLASTQASELPTSQHQPTQQTVPFDDSISVEETIAIMVLLAVIQPSKDFEFLAAERRQEESHTGTATGLFSSQPPMRNSFAPLSQSRNLNASFGEQPQFSSCGGHVFASLHAHLGADVLASLATLHFLFGAVVEERCSQCIGAASHTPGEKAISLVVDTLLGPLATVNATDLLLLPHPVTFDLYSTGTTTANIKAIEEDTLSRFLNSPDIKPNWTLPLISCETQALSTVAMSVLSELQCQAGSSGEGQGIAQQLQSSFSSAKTLEDRVRTTLVFLQVLGVCFHLNESTFQSSLLIPLIQLTLKFIVQFVGCSPTGMRLGSIDVIHLVCKTVLDRYLKRVLEAGICQLFWVESSDSGIDKPPRFLIPLKLLNDILALSLKLGDADLLKHCLRTAAEGSKDLAPSAESDSTVDWDGIVKELRIHAAHENKGRRIHQSTPVIRQKRGREDEEGVQNEVRGDDDLEEAELIPRCQSSTQVPEPSDGCPNQKPTLAEESPLLFTDSLTEEEGGPAVHGSVAQPLVPPRQNDLEEATTAVDDLMATQLLSLLKKHDVGQLILTPSTEAEESKEVGTNGVSVRNGDEKLDERPSDETIDSNSGVALGQRLIVAETGGNSGRTTTTTTKTSGSVEVHQSPQFVAFVKDILKLLEDQGIASARKVVKTNVEGEVTANVQTETLRQMPMNIPLPQHVLKTMEELRDQLGSQQVQIREVILREQENHLSTKEHINSLCVELARHESQYEELRRQIDQIAYFQPVGPVKHH